MYDFLEILIVRLVSVPSVDFMKVTISLEKLIFYLL
jgi:hypothetical protein